MNIGKRERGSRPTRARHPREDVARVGDDVTRRLRENYVSVAFKLYRRRTAGQRERERERERELTVD